MWPTETEQRIADLEKQVRAIESEEVPVECNEGTFGAEECCRCVGTGDPRFGNYTIWERVGRHLGQRVEGCDPKRAPGRGIRCRGAANKLAERRVAAKALWQEIYRLRKLAQAEADQYRVRR